MSIAAGSDTNVLHLACCCDERYVRHTAAMALSVVAQLGMDLSVEVHLLHRDAISVEAQKKFRDSLELYGARLSLVQVTDELMHGFPTGKFHESCWYRIFIPDLLPTISRVLYLDSDMIAFDNLLPLWRSDLEGKAFGAVVNPLYPFNASYASRRLGLSQPRDYLNTGCLLMDLKQLRKLAFSEKLREYAEAHPANAWPEQDAISVVFKGQWMSLAPRWNAQSTFFELNVVDLPCDQNAALEAKLTPGIVHYIGNHKPWHYLCRHPLRQAYFQWASKTAWGSPIIEGRTVFNALIRWLPLRVQLSIQLRFAKFLRKFA